MSQAAQWIAAYETDLASRGLGFSPDDLDVIAEVARTHPFPAGTPAGEDKALPFWTPLLTEDMVIATLYDQLFSQVGELPRR